MTSTYFAAVLASAREAVTTEPGASQLKGLNKKQVVDAVEAITNGLDQLDPTVNLHIMLYALTYVRNAIIVAMEDNRRLLETSSEGTA